MELDQEMESRLNAANTNLQIQVMLWVWDELCTVTPQPVMLTKPKIEPSSNNFQVYITCTTHKASL